MKGYKHSTPEQRTLILQLHAVPTPTTVIAERLGISIHVVRHTVHRAGLQQSGAKNGACYRNVDLVRRLAKEGKSLSEIGRQVGTSKRLVKLFLEKHQIERTPFHQSGENNPAWKGGRMADKHGYILVHRPEHPEANRHGYVREHRLVMEEKLGRPLLREEVVHHLDDDTGNNHPDNLHLYESNGVHLAETRAGKMPNWSEEGRLAVIEACRRGRESPKRSSRSA